MNYLVHPSNIVSRALGIDSFKQMINDEQIQFSELVDTSVQIAEEWTNDWDEGDGFGSSDGTYLLKDFIDTVISNYSTSHKYMTDFTPYLSVVPYSEAKHHERVQRMESEI
tara:strand:- start:286 stop:618 length:333 start_codon:yes stop_codon:yes gene_type:complete